MSDQSVAYVCDPSSFLPSRRHQVRWLDVDADFDLFAGFQDSPITREDVRHWAAERYTYAAATEGARIVSVAAEWRYAEDASELAAVRTIEARRRAGLAQSVCSFVTEAILATDRIATCHTTETNLAMQRLAESLGYVRVAA